MDTTLGGALHKRAESILGRSDYTQDQYVAALSQAQAEADALAETLSPEERLALAMRADPLLRRELEGRVLAAAADKILADEGRQGDADRFVQVFTDLARSSALYGYENSD